MYENYSQGTKVPLSILDRKISIRKGKFFTSNLSLKICFLLQVQINYWTVKYGKQTQSMPACELVYTNKYWQPCKLVQSFIVLSLVCSMNNLSILICDQTWGFFRLFIICRTEGALITAHV